MGRACSTHGEKTNTCRTSVGKPEGTRSLGRPRCTRMWVDNIKMDLREIRMDWVYLAKDRDQWKAFVNTVMNRRVPRNVGKFFSSCSTSGFSRRVHLHGVS
jgi:hypothetical protein